MKVNNTEVNDIYVPGSVSDRQKKRKSAKFVSVNRDLSGRCDAMMMLLMFEIYLR